VCIADGAGSFQRRLTLDPTRALGS
jgi:hypothetical protein